MSGVKRRYESPLRQKSAAATRRAVVVAATDLFEQRGYDSVSLADVAVAAQVSRPTVTAAFGTKGRLLAQCLDQALAGDDEPVPVAQRPWFAPVWDAGSAQEVLSAYADVCTLIGGRAAHLFEVVRQAADGGPEVAHLWEQAQSNRRAGAQMVVERVRVHGFLRPELAGDKAVDVLWIYNDPALYAALVGSCGWSREDFSRWLADRMCSALLP